MPRSTTAPPRSVPTSTRCWPRPRGSVTSIWSSHAAPAPTSTTTGAGSAPRPPTPSSGGGRRSPATCCRPSTTSSAPSSPPGVDPAERPDPGGEQPSEEVSARDALAEGVALVYRELTAALQRAGVVSFDPVGERFDPSHHEAIATGQAEGVESGTVLETLERGYRVDSQVIRPARVVVSG